VNKFVTENCVLELFKDVPRTRISFADSPMDHLANIIAFSVGVLFIMTGREKEKAVKEESTLNLYSQISSSTTRSS